MCPKNWKPDSDANPSRFDGFAEVQGQHHLVCRSFSRLGVLRNSSLREWSVRRVGARPDTKPLRLDRFPQVRERSSKTQRLRAPRSGARGHCGSAVQTRMLKRAHGDSSFWARGVPLGSSIAGFVLLAVVVPPYPKDATLLLLLLQW